MDEITNISIAVIAVALTLPILSQLLLRRPKLLSACKYIIFGVYLLACLSETLLFREAMPQPSYALELFWSYRASLQADGGPMMLPQTLFSEGIRAAFAALHITQRGLLKQIILNILLFVPMGYLLPFLWPKLAGNRGFPWRVLLMGFLSSALVETAQLVFHLGLFELDDIFNNTMGCAIGLVLYLLVVRKASRGSPA